MHAADGGVWLLPVTQVYSTSTYLNVVEQVSPNRLFEAGMLQRDLPSHLDENRTIHEIQAQNTL